MNEQKRLKFSCVPAPHVLGAGEGGGVVLWQPCKTFAKRAELRPHTCFLIFGPAHVNMCELFVPIAKPSLP